MRTRSKADKIVTNVLRQIAAECDLPDLNRLVTGRLIKGSRFQLTAKDYGSELQRLPLYEQVCRVDGPNVYWKTVFPGNKFTCKRRSETAWVLDNAKVLRR